MKAISEDLRERAVAAVVSEGWSRTRAGEVYGISAVSVGRYVAAYQAGESLTPRQGGGRPRKLRLPEHVEALREHLATINAQDARGWFKHCDFPLPDRVLRFGPERVRDRLGGTGISFGS